MFNIPTYLIEQQVLAATAASVTLTYVAPSVAWTPRHLVVRINGKFDVAHGMRWQLNSDTGSNYNQQSVQGMGSSPAAALSSGIAHFFVNSYSGAANIFSSTEILFPDALSTRSQKSMILLHGKDESQVEAIAGRWANTDAITSIRLFPSGDLWDIGSTFDLAVVDESFNHSEQII